jgi:hypothetical protein
MVDRLMRLNRLLCFTLHSRDERLIVVPRPLVTMFPTCNAL